MIPDHERMMFNRIWSDLFSEVNQRHKIVDEELSLSHMTDSVRIVLNKAFTNTELLDEHIAIKAKEYDMIHMSVLKSWRKHFVKGVFALMAERPGYSVLMKSDRSEMVLYGVQSFIGCIRNQVSEMPHCFETTLLPFHNRIIYNATIHSHGKTQDQEKKHLTRFFKATEEYFKVATTLPVVPFLLLKSLDGKFEEFE
ncbi:MAG: hypothetical protein LBC41_08000 [Clostridiales bacterium]|nr:hypothetical protein [Clostridiales bacterium]MDR2750585.1 hypothetical protein [Clostridiales bacterium]